MTTAFSEACAVVERALAGSARQQLVSELAKSRPFGKALARLRQHVRANALEPFLTPFDHRTRQEGFHVLHDWDGKADHVSEEMIPVDVLDYVARLRGGEETHAPALAVLLDYYYFHVLQLLSLRIWDEGDADANLDRVGQLLALLQGPGGSGQPFVANAETLILIATSHFEEVERGYDRLLRRVKTLHHAHQVNVALGHAASMGCHLRFGYEATYGRDTMQMRDDNVADYPWLCFALATVMREYDRLRDAGVDADGRAPIVEALVNGLSPDARAFIGVAPMSLSTCEADGGEIRDRFLARRSDLVAEFERHRPVEGVYSPLSLFFNFSHNVLKGTIVDALLRGKPWPIAFNEMLTGITVRLKPDTTDDAADRERLARTLMDYARANPDRIGGRLTPVIVYDPRAGHRAFRIMMEKVSMETPPAPVAP
ncbi:MAG TPA: hypothetical protein VNG89_01350, partial [Vicinamibacterales bacterium]|nr:hypothetical protein [Vicinamibacterales bacterium]